MRITHVPTRARLAGAASLIAVAALLAGCSTAAPQSQTQSATQSSDHVESTGSAQETQAAATRLALTYDGGVLVVDADTLKVVQDLPVEGFNRLSPSGDGRHVMLSTAGKFQALDMGTWAQGHGDHFHYFTDTPALTDVAYAADTPGHVVPHGGKTALFDDATGKVQIVDTDKVGVAGTKIDTYQSAAAHHGVAVPLEGDTLLVTTGTEEARDGAVALGKNHTALTDSHECPSIHGEGVASTGIVAFGCADGALLYHDGAFEKITSPDQNGRLGTLLASEKSPVILSNYTPNYEDGAPEGQTTKIALIDTDTEAIRAVDAGTTYSFRSLARGDNGEIVILGTDGALHVLDPASGKPLGAYPVIEPWKVPQEWQAPRPAVFVVEGTAYVVDPQAKAIKAVDVETGEVWNEGTLPQVTNELTGVTGRAISVSHEHDEHEDGHDHDH